MTEQQKKLVDMLAWFHNFCEVHKLRYYIIAGTMLGAVRHKGFIPWDDDIDVGMPRVDYEKLRTLFESCFDEKYVFEFPTKDNVEYPYLIAKLYDKGTTFVEKQRYVVKRGIYMDIFPLDGIGNNMEDAKENYSPFYWRYCLNLMINGAFLKRRSLKKNLAVFLGRIISPLFVNRKKLSLKIDELAKRYDFDDSKIVSNLMGGSKYKGMVPYDYFGTPTLIDFENIKVYGLEKPDLYLKAMYGDYMSLPPEDKRISFHDTIYCDLNKSFLEE